jgi:hypothetical protein
MVAATEPSMAMYPDGDLLLLGSSFDRNRGYMYREFKQQKTVEETVERVHGFKENYHYLLQRTTLASTWLANAIISLIESPICELAAQRRRQKPLRAPSPHRRDRRGQHRARRKVPCRRP